jgi:hypothetical protein
MMKQTHGTNNSIKIAWRALSSRGTQTEADLGRMFTLKQLMKVAFFSTLLCFVFLDVANARHIAITKLDSSLVDNPVQR